MCVKDRTLETVLGLCALGILRRESVCKCVWRAWGHCVCERASESVRGRVCLGGRRGPCVGKHEACVGEWSVHD